MGRGTLIAVILLGVVIAAIAAAITVYALRKNKAQKPADAAGEAAEKAVEEAQAEQAAAEAPAAEAEETPEETPAEDEAEQPEEAVGEEPKQSGEPVSPAVSKVSKAPKTPVSAGAAQGDVAGEMLAVGAMSPALRAAMGLTGEGHEEEVYSVRYSYSFKARLALSTEETKGYYAELAAEIGSYKKLRRRESRRQQNVTLGRQRVAAILFKGKKLWLALALDPKEFEGTKYRGKDVSAMKRFEGTPMLFKVDSPRRIKYAKVLIARLAEENGLQQGKVTPWSGEDSSLTRDELIAAKEIKVTFKRAEPTA